jgi:hypothetical protein
MLAYEYMIAFSPRLCSLYQKKCCVLYVVKLKKKKINVLCIHISYCGDRRK